MSQTYKINNIISKSGIVQDNNDKYIAYSDQSIDLSYDVTNAEQGFGLNDDTIIQIKWFFEKNNQRVELNDGDYNDKDGQSNVTACIECLPGTYSTEIGAKSNSICFPCPSGTYGNQSGE